VRQVTRTHEHRPHASLLLPIPTSHNRDVVVIREFSLLSPLIRAKMAQTLPSRVACRLIVWMSLLLDFFWLLPLRSRARLPPLLIRNVELYSKLVIWFLRIATGLRNLFHSVAVLAFVSSSRHVLTAVCSRLSQNFSKSGKLMYPSCCLYCLT